MLRKPNSKNTYVSNVITLITGTGLAQAIPILISPLLTRLYSPEEFGMFAVYLALVYIATVFATGRYEFAIMLPKNDRDAFQIVALVVCLAIILSGFILVIVSIFNQQIIQALSNPRLDGWLHWIPLSTLALGIYTSLNYWCNRKSNYKNMAVSRVAQTASTSFIQVTAGNMNAGASGLIGGQLIGHVFSMSILASIVYRFEKHRIKLLRLDRMIILARKYRDFPKFLVVAHALNTASANLPVLLLSSVFSSAAAGHFILLQRVMGAPMILIAGAIGDVFRQEASHAYVKDGNCKVVYIQTFKRLLLISAAPFIVFFLAAPMFFTWTFGQNWSVAGVYAQILTPMFFMKFVTSPLSSMYLIAEKQRLDLLWQIVLFIATLSSFLIGNLYSDLSISLIFYSSVYCLLYAVNGLISYLLATGHWKA